MSKGDGILVVDDDLATLKWIVEILASHGLTVRPTVNGEHALKSIQAGAPELILLDVHMPGIDGFQICRQLQSNESTRSIPILFLSASGDADERVKGLELGAVDFVSKPIRSNELLARVQTHLELSRLRVGLESKVLERTRELEEAVASLRRGLEDRRQAEEALRKSEERFSLAMQATREGLWDWDLRADECYFSPAYCEILGFEQTALPATPDSWRGLIHPEDTERAERANRDCIEGRCEAFEVEFRMMSRDRGWRWILSCGRSVARDGQGRALRLVGTHVDITEWKSVEARLSEQAALLQHAHDAIVVTGLSGAIISWNRGAENLYGWRQDEVVGENISQLLRSEFPIPLVEIKAALQDRDQWEGEITHQTRSGSKVVVTSRWSLRRSEKGEPSKILEINRDITERKRDEEAIQHREEALQQSNRKLHQLSKDLLRAQDYERRRIARELHDSTSQLLAALRINITRLQESGLDPDRRSQALREAADIAAQCSTEIRTVTYLLHPPLLDDIGLIAALQAYTEGFKQRTGINIEVDIPPLFGRLGIDIETALFRIVQEGLANIHKHSGSHLALVRLERNADEVRLVVRDWGRGFSEPLRKAGSGTARLGVGLMGMRERAEQLGGRLELASSDAGTMVTVKLPLVESHEENSNTPGR